MKPATNKLLMLIAIIFFAASSSFAQSTTHTFTLTKSSAMKTYIIEREIPGAGELTGDQLKAVSQKSCSVLDEMGPKIEWVHSYVTGNKIFCIYKAENEELIREHARKGGFPANAIHEIANVISPATAN